MRPTLNRTGFELLKLDNQLCFALYAASRAMTKTYREKLAPIGLTYPQYLVLTVLWEKDQLTLTEIGNQLHLDSGTLTPLVKRLEQAGYLTRDRRTSDEREIEIALTDKGRAVRDDGISVRAHVVCRLGMDEADIGKLRSELISVLEQLESGLDETCINVEAVSA
jgi:MarR family transcriptional regulator, organic hydroperoxide resistance regulator